MLAPYSLDLRERVVAVASGMKAGPGRRRIIRRATHRRSAGPDAWLRPAKVRRHCRWAARSPFTLADEEAWIRARIEEKPDITGRELLVELKQRGIAVSYYGVWYFVDRVGLSFKACAPASRIERRRVPAAAMEATPEQDPCRTVDLHR